MDEIEHEKLKTNIVVSDEKDTVMNKNILESENIQNIENSKNLPNLDLEKCTSNSQREIPASGHFHTVVNFDRLNKHIASYEIFYNKSARDTLKSLDITKLPDPKYKLVLVPIPEIEAEDDSKDIL